jgi:hypothetical protein
MILKGISSMIKFLEPCVRHIKTTTIRPIVSLMLKTEFKIYDKIPNLG